MATQVESIKWVPGTRFMVDGFGFANARCSQYFLTHMHSDHTTGLTRGFDAGTIWASPISTRLLAAEWGLRPPRVRVLQLGQPVVVDGVSVTALDANHCPGAIMLLFEVPLPSGSGSGSGRAQGAGPDDGVRRILHTGDCRWHDGLRSGSSCLAGKRIDVLMLDTTYALPRHTFPPQQEAIAHMAQVMRDALAAEPSTLFVCSAYHIGKERCYLGAAAAVGVRVYVSAAKRRVLELLELPPQHMALLSDHPSAPLHVGVCSLAPPELAAYLERQQAEQRAAGCAERSVWRRVVGFRATGWSYRASGGPAVQRLGDAVSAHGIPYSEHSSWHELRDCVRALRPRRLIPTVNAGSRAAQQAITDRLAALMDLSCDRGRIDAYLVPAAPGSSGSSSSGGASGGSGGASGTRPAPGAAAAYGGGAGGASPGQGGRKQQEEHEQQQQQQQQQSGEPCAACEQDETPRAACELQCDVWGSPEQGTLAADRAEAAALPAERGGEGSPDCSAGGQPQQPQQQVRQQVQQQHQQPQVQQQPCGGAAAGVEVDVAAAAAAPLDAAGLPGAAVAADQARDTHSRDQQDGRQQKQPEKQPPPPAKQQRQPPGAAGAADGTQLGWHVQLAGLPEPVDLAEQQRLLGDAERVKRLRHSLQLRQEAAAARKRRKAAAACAGRRR